MADKATLARPPRNTAIDAMRYVLAFVVVLLHSLPSAQQAEYPSWAAFMSIFCRVSVPFFFITSGYFLKPGGRLELSVVFKPLQRLLPIYLFWMLAYFVFLQLVPIQHWSFSPRDLISGGTAFHLWFLPALGFALVLVSGGIGLIGMRATGALCLALAIFGIFRGSYHDALHLSGTAQRGGLFIAPLFVYLGVLVKTQNWSLGRWAVPAILVSYLLLILEEWLIYRLSDAPTFSSHDFDVATYLVGLSCFLAIRQIPASAVIDRIAWFGPLSLSVYAGHVAFLWMLAPLIGNDAVWRVTLLAVFCFGLATLLSLALMRVPGLRRVIT
jgi:surface polysaccharide O-acyltransferase-like enzyme